MNQCSRVPAGLHRVVEPGTGTVTTYGYDVEGPFHHSLFLFVFGITGNASRR